MSEPSENQVPEQQSTHAAATQNVSSNTATFFFTSGKWIWPSSVLGMLLCLGIYLLRLDRVSGFFVDDGWYVLLAKSLATGQGYSLINSPSPGIFPLYPPAFPFLLSLVFRVVPLFPQNLWALKMVSIVAMLAVGFVTFRYCARQRQLPPYVALGLGLAVVLCPPLVFLATSTVMSESVFTLIFLLAVVVVEKSVQAARTGMLARAWQFAALGGALAAAGFLTRSIALALIAAGFLYFLKERLFKLALVFTGGVILIAGPWMIYSRTHQPTPEQRQEQGGHIVLPYTEQFWQKRAGFEDSGAITAEELPKRVLNNSIEIAGRDVLHVLAAPVFEALRDPFAEIKRDAVREGRTGEPLFFSFILCCLVLAGFIATIRERITMAEIAVPLSLVITILWPWETFRFILPLVPFLLLYTVLGVRWLHSLHQRMRQRHNIESLAAGMGLAVAVFLAISLYANVSYLLKQYGGDLAAKSQWVQSFAEAEAMMNWVKNNVNENDVIVTNNPPLVHLYTGRKTVAVGNIQGNWQNWKRLGVRYLLQVSIYQEPPDPSERKFKTVYSSRGPINFRVVDLGPAESRPSW